MLLCISLFHRENLWCMLCLMSVMHKETSSSFHVSVTVSESYSGFLFCFQAHTILLYVRLYSVQLRWIVFFKTTDVFFSLVMHLFQHFFVFVDITKVSYFNFSVQYSCFHGTHYSVYQCIIHEITQKLFVNLCNN